MSLNSLGSDLLAEIICALDGCGLIALSQASRNMASSIPDRIWRAVFENDFGPRGQDALRVLGSRTPEISWRCCYVFCFYRKVVIWGDLDRLSEARQKSHLLDELDLLEYSLDELYLSEYSLSEPHIMELPHGVVPRDVVCLDHVYVLDIEGKIWCLDAENRRSSNGRLVVNDSIKDQPCTFVEMAATDELVFGVSASGDWWVWDDIEWSLAFENKPIWPGSLLTRGLGCAIALSACGRRIFISAGVYAKYIIDMPYLSQGPALDKVDSFIVSTDIYVDTRVGDRLVCLQVHGKCYLAIVSPILGLITASLVFPLGSRVVAVNFWQQEYRDVLDDNFEHWYEFRLTCADGKVVHCKNLAPIYLPATLTFSQLPVKGTANEIQNEFCGPHFYYQLTNTGELYGEGKISSGTKAITEDGGEPSGSSSVHSQLLPVHPRFYWRNNKAGASLKVRILPVTNFLVHNMHASALCLPE